MTRWSRLRLAATVVLVVAVGFIVLAACVPSALPTGVRADVFGDSLTVQAASELTADGLTVHAYGGTAPCDWLPRYAADLARDRPTVVVLAFTGNHGTACMASAKTDVRVVARYRADLAMMGGSAALRAHIRVAFVVPPLMAATAAADLPHAGPAIGVMECALAATAPSRAACSTTARDLLSPAGVYSATDAAGETVRAADGVHLAGSGIDLYARGLVAAAS